MKVLVTGANGFVGRRLLMRLSNLGRYQIVATIQRQPNTSTPLANIVKVANLTGHTDWSAVLEGVEAVVHLAARVHVMSESSRDPLAEFHQVNVVGTQNLARQATAVGVKRFIFLSTIKVNGETTQPGHPFTEQDPPAPKGPYAISKYEAEEVLRQLAKKTGLPLTIIRPPLVYGPGVKANFKKMMRWVDRGVPLPLGGILNQRSLVALDNLVDLIVTCIDHPAAANQIFLASDGEDLSTTELLQRMAKALGRPARLIPVPVKLLQWGAALLGKQSIAQRLCGTLTIDIKKARSLLGWNPPISVDEGLFRTAKYFLHEKMSRSYKIVAAD